MACEERLLPPLVSTAINQPGGRPSFYLDLTGSQPGSKVSKAASLLRLTSPELDKLISEGVAVVATPTPTTQILFPNTVTEVGWLFQQHTFI